MDRVKILFFLFVKMNFLPSAIRLLDSKWKVAKKVIQVYFLLFSKLFEVINKKMSILYQCFGIIDSHGSFCFPKIIFQRNSDHLKTFKEIHSRFLGQKSHFLLKICNSVLSKLHYFFLVFQKLFFFFLTYVWTCAPKLMRIPRLNLWILNGNLMEPQHKKIFSKLIFVATFASCCNRNH